MKQSFPFQQYSILEKIDIFGIEIGIRFNQFKNHKTVFGGIVTVIILSIILYQTFKISSYVLQQQNPTVIQQQRYVYQPELFHITPSNYNIAIGIQDEDSVHFLDERIYKLRAFQEKNVRVYNLDKGNYEQIIQTTEIKMEQCTKNHFQIAQTLEYFVKLPLDQLYCFSLSEDNILIEGEFSAEKYQAIQFIVELCVDDIECKEEEIVKQKMQNPRLGAYITDVFVDVMMRDKPFQIIGKNIFYPTSYDLHKEVRIYLQNNYIETDVGYLTSEIQNDRVISYNDSREFMTIRKTKQLFKAVIAYEKNTEFVYRRSYMKLDQAFSQIGGIFNILVSIGCLLCWPISQLELNRKLINQAFDIIHKNNSNNSIAYHQKNQGSLQQNQKPKDKQYNNKIAGDKNHTKQKSIFDGSIFVDFKRRINFNSSDNKFNQQQQQQLNYLSNKDDSDNSSNKGSNKEETSQKIEYSEKDNFYDKDERNSSGKKFIEMRQSIFNKDIDSIRNPIDDKGDDQNVINNKIDNQQANPQLLANKLIENNQNIIKVSFLDYLKNYLQIFKCCQSKKSRLIKQGTNLLYQQIDIFYIINKLIEVEKLKYILLDENQIKLFEFLPKPMLSMDHLDSLEKLDRAQYYESQTNRIAEQDLGYYLIKRKTDFEKAKEAQESYLEIKKNRQQDKEINKKIIHLLKLEEFNLNQQENSVLEDQHIQNSILNPFGFQTNEDGYTKYNQSKPMISIRNPNNNIEQQMQITEQYQHESLDKITDNQRQDESISIREELTNPNQVQNTVNSYTMDLLKKSQIHSNKSNCSSQNFIF